MPSNVNRPSAAGYTPVAQNEHNIVRLGNEPTLAGLLAKFTAVHGDENLPLLATDDGRILVPTSPPSLWKRFKAALSDLPLLNRSASLRSARAELMAQPLERHAIGDVLRNGVVFSIRKELGDDQADMMSWRLNDNKKPLTLRSVVEMLEPLAKWSAEGKAAPRGRPAAETGSLAAALGSRSPDDRHEGLLSHCAALISARIPGMADVHAVVEAAKQLHDRARGLLEARGRWSLEDPEDFENNAKVAADSVARDFLDSLDYTELTIATPAAAPEPILASKAHAAPEPALPLEPTAAADPVLAFTPAAAPLEALPARRSPDDRHGGLLNHCADLVRAHAPRTADAHALTEAAKQLHDRARGLLEARDRWSLEDSEDFEENAKVAANNVAEDFLDSLDYKALAASR